MALAKWGQTVILSKPCLLYGSPWVLLPQPHGQLAVCPRPTAEMFFHGWLLHRSVSPQKAGSGRWVSALLETSGVGLCADVSMLFVLCFFLCWNFVFLRSCIFTAEMIKT